MKKINFLTLTFALLLTIFAFSAARAQDAATEPDAQNFQQPQQNRPRIAQALGLTPDQVQQLRRINQARKPIMQSAQRNWRLAQRDLDAAIYAENPNEEEIKLRLREAQNAHAELLKERVATEFLIRKLLTPEQLQKFLELRASFRPRVNNPDNQNNPRQRPLKRMLRRRNQAPQQQPNF